jgi:hypothetical protein
MKMPRDFFEKKIQQKKFVQQFTRYYGNNGSRTLLFGTLKQQYSGDFAGGK